MKKNFILGLLLLPLLGIGMLGAADKPKDASNLKFGLVDLQKALNDIDAGKKAKADLQGQFEAKQKKLQLQKQEVDKLKGDFEKQRLVASDTTLQTEEDELRKKVIGLQEELNKSQQDLANQEMQVTQRLLGELRTLVGEIGAKDGYTAIFEKSQNVLLYSPIATDLTEQVIAAYNKKKP